jgi:hypothetical protein
MGELVKTNRISRPFKFLSLAARASCKQKKSHAAQICASKSQDAYHMCHTLHHTQQSEMIAIITCISASTSAAFVFKAAH